MFDMPDYRLCGCNSGLERWPLYDARGIFVTNVCDKCEEQAKSHFRPEIFEDCNYWVDEPIEDDDMYENSKYFERDIFEDDEYYELEEDY